MSRYDVHFTRSISQHPMYRRNVSANNKEEAIKKATEHFVQSHPEVKDFVSRAYFLSQEDR